MRRQNSNFSNGTRMNTDFRGFFLLFDGEICVLSDLSLRVVVWTIPPRRMRMRLSAFIRARPGSI